MRWRSRAGRALLILILLLPAACSISRGLSDSSDSSESSSRSSTSKERRSAYREDICVYTAAHVVAGGEIEAFEKKLGELARRYGVTNWEDDPTTYVSIGQGLGDAGVGEVQLATYKRHFSRSDPLRMQAIQRGYDTRQ